MGQDVDRLARLLGRGDCLDQAEPVAADLAVDLDILVGDCAGAGVGRVHPGRRRERRERPLHLVNSPSQIDRGRPRRGQHLAGMVERRVGSI